MRNAPARVRHLYSIIDSLEPRRLLSGSGGAFDTTFSGDGVATVPATTVRSYTANASAVQADGKVVTVGTTSDHQVIAARFNLDGSADPTFGDGGTKIFKFSKFDDAGLCVTIQPDGKILVGGALDHADLNGDVNGFVEDDSNIAVARLTTTGQLDPSFGDSGGVFSINLTDSVIFHDAAQATKLLLTSNNQIIVAGQVDTSPDDIDFLALRLYTNGKLDHTYGVDGVIEEGLGGDEPAVQDYVRDAAIDRNGTAATNPNFNKVTLVGYNAALKGTTDRIGVVRLTAAGKPDNSFSGDGKLLMPFVSGYAVGVANAVAITATDNYVIAATVAKSDAAHTDVGLLSLNKDGSVNKAFGDLGTVQTDLGGSDDARGLVIGQTGEYVVAGQRDGHFASAAYTGAGKLDTAYGTNGIVYKASVPGALGLSVGSTGTLVAAGGSNFSTERFTDAVPTIAIASLDPDATEGGDTAGFLVTQSAYLDYDRRIYLDIGGSARKPIGGLGIPKLADYTLSGVAQPIGDLPYVVMPAGESVVSVTLTAINDTLVEGDETATFALIANPGYDIDPKLAATTITIHDNDGVAAKAFNATADAFVKDGSSAGMNFGAAPTLEVKQNSAGSSRQAYLKFDLSSLATVSSVKLQLYGSAVGGNGESVATQIFGVGDTTWTETGLTNNNKPAASGGVLGTMTVASGPLQLFVVDLTAYVKAQIAAGHKVISLLLKAAASTNSVATFDSREASTDGPQLLVT